jgi:hypothetical protein
MGFHRFLKAIAAILLLAAPCLLLSAPGAAADPVARNIGVFGDSLGDGVYGGLYLVVKSHHEDTVFHYSKVGAGLTRPDYATWFTEFTTELDRDHITHAVVMFGSNDEQGIRDENRKGYVFPTDAWKTVYTARVDGVHFPGRDGAAWRDLPAADGHLQGKRRGLRHPSSRCRRPSAAGSGR